VGNGDTCLNPSTWRLRLEDGEFEASQSYIARLCLKNKNNNNKKLNNLTEYLEDLEKHEQTKPQIGKRKKKKTRNK
jgi:hypothetical protein